MLTINVKSPKIYEELLLDSLINALGQFWLEISESWKNVAVYRCFKSWTMQDASIYFFINYARIYDDTLE